jgi:hypothetical protein
MADQDAIPIRGSLRDQLLSLPKGTPVKLDMKRFPRAPQNLYMRSPEATWIAKWEQKGVTVGRRNKIKMAENKNRKAELIQHMLCDEHGHLIFEPTDLSAIMAMDASIVGYWFITAMEVAGILQDDDGADEEEEAEGN